MSQQRLLTTGFNFVKTTLSDKGTLRQLNAESSSRDSAMTSVGWPQTIRNPPPTHPYSNFQNGSVNTSPLLEREGDRAPVVATLRRLISILLFFLLFLTTHLAFSQTYPVQVVTTLTPPYSVYLSDYTAVGANNLQVLVNLLELDRPALQVRFRIRIEGAGIILQTRSSFTPRPSVIRGGVPEIFLGPDLVQYFNPDNLDFEGITRSRFKQLGRLPEGFYTFTIEVLEYNRNVRVSNQSMTNAWIVLNDPPLINMPFNGDKLIASDPQNIMFSWTPRHLASPNAAFSTEYEFTLIELYPGQTNPEIAIRSSNSIFRTTTNLTSLNYGILEPTLIPGKNYAFRIRAYDISGRDLFKNQGFSETFVFQYGDACEPPNEIKTKTLDPERARITWEPFPNHTAMMIEFREQGSDQWYSQQTNSSYRILTSLAGSTTYEYQVSPQCGTVIGNKSPVYTFTTPELDPSAFVCGAPVPEFDESSVPLMKPLLPLDVVRVGDWTVNLVSVAANGDGTYAGAGYAAVPNFNLTNVRVTFDRILVNENYQVIAGDIKSVYSADSRFVVDLIPEPEPEVVEEAVAEPEIPEGPPEDMVADELMVMVPADIGEVVFSGGLLEVRDEEGNMIEDMDLDLPPEGEELTITDSNGDTWVVDSEGGVTASPVALDEPSEDPELSGLSRDPDMVVIHSISESFKPGTDRAEFTYTIRDTSLLPYRSLEIYYIDKDEKEELFTFYQLSPGEKIDFLDVRVDSLKGWSGKDNELKYVKPGNYKFKLIATRDKTFKHGYVEWETVVVKVASFPITVTQVQNIFPNTPETRITEVVNVLNNYSDDFGLTTKERMAHFLGQIGHESNSLNSLVESHNYSGESIFKVFLKVSRSKSGEGETHKYCHLISGYDCGDLNSCDSYDGPKRCSTEPDFYYPLDENDDPDYQKWVDDDNSVKTSFLNSSNLFNLTYCCRLGNGSYNSGDGSKYRGRGFIQLTGKDKYNGLSDLWNKKFPNNIKDFTGANYEEVGTNIEVAMIATLFEWNRLLNLKDVNGQYAFKNAVEGKFSDDNIKIVGRWINGSGSRPSNGEDDRISKSNNAYGKL